MTCASDTADNMDNDNFATVMKHYVVISSVEVAQVHSMKVPALDHLVLAKKWWILSKKALNTIWHIMQHRIWTVRPPFLAMQFRTSDNHLK